MLSLKVPNYLEEAFNTGYSFGGENNNKFDFFVTEIGLLNVQDGKIIACDPFLYNKDEPFSTTFPIDAFRLNWQLQKLIVTRGLALHVSNFQMLYLLVGAWLFVMDKTLLN